MSKPNTPRGSHGRDLHSDEDNQRNICPILTGISYLKWRRTHCDGSSFVM